MLEYASTAWNPHTNRDTENIEKVQRRAARFVANDYRRSTNSQELVNKLKWESLEARRLLSQVTLFYKIINSLMNINFPPDIKPSFRCGALNTNSYSLTQVFKTKVIPPLFDPSAYGTDSLMKLSL